MRNIRCVRICGEVKDINFLYKEYDKKCLLIKRNIDNVFLDIYEGDNYIKLLEYVEAHSMHVDYNFIKREFTKAEFSDMPYYRLLVDWNGNRRLYVGVYGNPYVYDQCEFCCTGKRQIEPLHVKLENMKKFDIFPVTPELVVSERIKDELENMHVTGCRFTEVFDIEKKRLNTKFYQVNVFTILPAAKEYTESSIRIIDRCQWCGYYSKGVNGTVGYQKSAFKENLDFYVMNENRFEEVHWSKNIKFRHQQFIISKKVKNILEKYSNHFFEISAVYIDDYKREC